uniref:R-LORF4 n=1 Tax=Gallid alphaherpesvirus 2 TaxID=10390 RepID=Q80RP2_9ALPH|nr:R-LORF4 [Gallid alphaherpesvirus 2]ABG22939.1 hypothetical protein MDV078.3 [Gallid alphaherpesvirus 2]
MRQLCMTRMRTVECICACACVENQACADNHTYGACLFWVIGLRMRVVCRGRMRTAKFIVVLVFCYAGVVGIFSYTFKGPHSLVFQYYHLLMQTPVHFSVSML